MNARIAAQPFVAGETFTAADVLYAGAFALFMDSPLLGENKTKALEDYVAGCVSRPARARAAAKDKNSCLNRVRKRRAILDCESAAKFDPGRFRIYHIEMI